LIEWKTADLDPSHGPKQPLFVLLISQNNALTLSQITARAQHIHPNFKNFIPWKGEFAIRPFVRRLSCEVSERGMDVESGHVEASSCFKDREQRPCGALSPSVFLGVEDTKGKWQKRV
jgi:hypothetical protein